MFFQNKINISNENMLKLYYVIFNIIAITIIIYIGVDTFYRVMRIQFVQAYVRPASSQGASEDTPSLKTGLKDYQTIVSRNIFSKITVPEQDGDINIDELKRTSLNLSLLGTIAGNDKTSAAIIEDKTNRNQGQGLYRVGDSIQNAVIKSIVRGKVVLRINNTDEVLTMDELESGGTAQASDTDQTVSVATATTTTATAIERNITIKRSLINESLENLNELLSQASIQPHSTDGVADGLTITGIKAGSIFRRMGLRNGDLIVGVNDDPINTPEDLINMYNDLKSAPEVSVQILRRGRLRDMNYTFTD